MCLTPAAGGGRAKREGQPGGADVSDDRYIEVHVGEVEEPPAGAGAGAGAGEPQGAARECSEAAADMRAVAHRLAAMERRLTSAAAAPAEAR